MKLPNWWQVTKPNQDILEKKFDESIFAADLSDVVNNKGPKEYQDAYIFFQRTYKTKGLENLLKNVFLRLNGKGGDPVIQLQTPFGGGKTHTLLTLYHSIVNKNQLKSFDIISSDLVPDETKVVVIVGTQADALKGKTPWGEIAHQLGVYEKIKEHDIKRRTPGKEILDNILGNDSVLILIDELVEYIVKVKGIFEEQIFAFAHELTEVVKAKKKCCLVCTLPSSASYGEYGEKVLNELQRIFGRVEAIYIPVEGNEIYEVIRKRLFDDLGDEKLRKKVAQYYFELYQNLGFDVPDEVKEIDYRERIELAYPIHPELIDVLYKQWGSFSTFQRTRGVLRLLAHIIADLYNNKVVSPLIQSSLINLGNQSIRREFIKHIGNEFDSVIEADISGKYSNASKLDKKMGSEYEKYSIIKGIATSVFIYSFSGGEKRLTTLPKIRVALLREGIPPTIVGDAISKMEEELWYFHSEQKQYSFKSQPNLNRIILQRMENVSNEKIIVVIKEYLNKFTKNDFFKVYIWPENSSDILDNKENKLIILSPEFTYDSEECKKLTSEIFERSSLSFRIYKNNLFIIAVDKSYLNSLYSSVKKYIVFKELKKDIIHENFSKNDQELLIKKLSEEEKNIQINILNAYRRLAMFSKTGIEWKDLGMPTVGTSNIAKRVYEYLISIEKILSKLTPKYILENVYTENENEKVLKDIYEFFLKVPGQPIPENIDVIIRSVKEGVKNGILGLSDENRRDKIHIRENVNPKEGNIVLRGDSIPKTVKESENTNGKTPTTIEEKNDTEKGENGKKVNEIILNFSLPWDKLSSIISGVIGPLKNESSSFAISITIEAKANNGFNENTLRNKVKETLNQLNANIIKWEEK